jgi:hypothetical protein
MIASTGIPTQPPIAMASMGIVRTSPIQNLRTCSSWW